MLARVNENSSATRNIKDINILTAAKWTKGALKEVTGATIKNCFKSVGLSKVMMI